MIQHQTDTKLAGTNQYLYTPEQRELIITKFLRGNQGCTKADIRRGLNGIISKNTIDKKVDEMIKDGKVEVDLHRRDQVIS